MQVETYEEQEVAEMTEEKCEAVQELIEKLGLEGQEEFYKKDTSTAPFPYRRMTLQEKFVYSVLFPSVTEIGKFRSGAIPLRVLQVAAHAKELYAGECKLLVWHSADVRKDPVLVLSATDPTEKWRKAEYVLARWGDALEEFSVLAERAKKEWANRSRADLSKIKTRVDAALENMDALAEICYREGDNKTYTFYE